MSLRVRPRESRVLVRRDETERQTRGGIILPDTARDKQTKGQVLAIGPGRRSDLGAFIPIDGLAVGDMVLFTKYAGDGFKIDGEEYFLVDAKDIVAVIEPAPEPEPIEDTLEADAELPALDPTGPAAAAWAYYDRFDLADAG
jgi:chaperonin GroES